MTYEIIILPVAQRQLERLEKNVQERILNSLERIKIRPYDFVRKLTGSPFYKLRVGDYRIILKILNETMIIYVVEVGNRKNIYKNI